MSHCRRRTTVEHRSVALPFRDEPNRSTASLIMNSRPLKNPLEPGNRDGGLTFIPMSLVLVRVELVLLELPLQNPVIGNDGGQTPIQVQQVKGSTGVILAIDLLGDDIAKFRNDLIQFVELSLPVVRQVVFAILDDKNAFSKILQLGLGVVHLVLKHTDLHVEGGPERGVPLKGPVHLVGVIRRLWVGVFEGFSRCVMILYPDQQVK